MTTSASKKHNVSRREFLNLKELLEEARVKKIPVEIDLTWVKDLQGSDNILELDVNLLDKSLDPSKGGILPPHLGNEEWKRTIGDKATYLGRYQIPNQYVLFNAEEVQPRAKALDHDHRLDLKISFNAQGYKLDAPCPVATTTKDLNKYTVKGLSGFHRYSVFTDKDTGLNAVSQDSYFYDLYDFDTPLYEVIARNITNHHNNPAKSLTKQDLVKEVTNAIEAKIIEREVESIETFVDAIASDKPAYWRSDIAKLGFAKAGVTPQFRSYSTKGDNQFTLSYAVQKEHQLVRMGVENRSDEE